MSTAITTQQKEEKFTRFVPFGAKDEIKLSIEIVKRMVAVKTKRGATCDDIQAAKFIALCQSQRLNPFAGDAFLIGYDGQDGPQFSLITAHQAFLKRAEVCEDYDGMESGVIIQPKDGGEITEVQGDFYDGETSNLLGGWAKVYHRKRKIPTYRRLKVQRFNKGFGVWKDDPAGMICKCAEADALRSTFPTMLGGLYMQDEMPTATVIDVSSVASGAKLVASVSSDASPEKEQKDVAQLQQPESQVGTSDKPSPQQELANLVTNAGHDFNTFQKWGLESGMVSDADSLADFGDIKTDVAKRMLRATAGLLKGLDAIKAGVVQ